MGVGTGALAGRGFLALGEKNWYESLENKEEFDRRIVAAAKKWLDEKEHTRV
jgi:hypothetical protein